VRKESILFVLIGVLYLLPEYLAAQDAPTIPLEKFYIEREGHPLRKILKDLHFSLGVGAGTTYFKHKLDGFGIYQTPNKGPYIFSGNAVPTNGYSQWISTKVRDTIVNAASGFLVSSDSSKLGFKSKSFTIPLSLSLNYELKNFRFGLGYAKDLILMNSFKPISYSNKIRPVEASAGSVWTTKIYGTVGYSFYRLSSFVFTADFRAGTNKFGKKFNRSIIKPSPFFNLGLTVEMEMSENLRFFVRPSFEFKSYALSLSEVNQSIKHKSNSLFWSVGINYSIPELPRCKIKGCQIQINHAHGNKEYRSRMHSLTKKQNPGYGENDPKLIRDKWRNRKKINPY